jgi:hypothetical protein
MVTKMVTKMTTKMATKMTTKINYSTLTSSLSYILNYIENNYLIIYPNNNDQLELTIFIDYKNEYIINYIDKYIGNTNYKVIKSSFNMDGKFYTKIIKITDLEALKFLSSLYLSDKNTSDLFNEFKEIYNNQEKYIKSDLFYL